MPEENVGAFIWEIDRLIESSLTDFSFEGQDEGIVRAEDFITQIISTRINEQLIFDFAYDRDRSIEDNLDVAIEHARNIILARIAIKRKQYENIIASRTNYFIESLKEQISAVPTKLVGDLENKVDEFVASIDQVAKATFDSIVGKRFKPKIKKERLQEYIDKFEGTQFGRVTTTIKDFAKERSNSAVNNIVASKFKPGILDKVRAGKRDNIVGFDPKQPAKTEKELIANTIKERQFEETKTVPVPRSSGNEWIPGVSGYGDEYTVGDKIYKDVKNKELRFPITNKRAQELKLINSRLSVPFYFVDLRSNNYCYFNAIITSLGDNFSPSWNKETYFGRSEGLSKYINTDREIPISFSLIAETLKDLVFMYTKIDWLTQAVYPSYKNNDVSNIMEKSPLLRIRIGDVVKSAGTGLAGYITSLNYSYDLEMGWEISTEGIKVPRKIDISLSFSVIHDAMPNAVTTKFYDVLTNIGGITNRDLYNTGK